MHYRQLILDILDALKGLRRRPLRSLLSSLGIGIGVTALIAMLSISEGAKRKALAKISSLGTDTLRIEDATSAAMLEQESLANLSIGLTLEDAERLRSWLGDRGKIGSYIRQNSVVVASDTTTASVTLFGVSWEWFRAEKLRFEWGRPITSYDEQTARPYFIVGATVAKNLSLHPGTILKVADLAGPVIGVLKERGSLLTEGTGLSSLDFDKSVFMPQSAVSYGRVVAGQRLLDGLVIALDNASEDMVLKVGDSVHNQLLSRHRQVEDFRLVIPVSLLREARESQRLFSLIMGAIAGLSLLVGGIGVMNVMLANISEQTREIGLRMSLGADRMRIVWYYLCNSILLTLSGGVWGTAGGLLVAYGIQKYAGWEVAFSAPALFIAPLAAVLTGLVFGLHPAMRAAGLDPAVALRES